MCPVCGKIFYKPGRIPWSYFQKQSGKKKYLCSWACVMQCERRLHG
nr:MAG TPA: protein of unknown function (DUF3330) [Caudoviricetes sp.]